MVRLAKISIIIIMLSSLNPDVSGRTENYSSSSVLSSGKWFKIAVTKDGIYRIDYQKLKQLGLENPSNPRIFGNNCGQLSYFNDGSNPDDLKEIAIYLNNGSDGIFNEGDYLLFYCKGTHRWIYDDINNDFIYLRHNYSDTAFYFLTSSGSPGKRIWTGKDPASEPDYFTSVSDALFVHEKETQNILHSGREWYQPVSFSKELEVNPEFKDIVMSENITYQIRVLARSSSATLFRLTENGSAFTTIQVRGINLASTTGTFAQAAMTEGEFQPSSSEPVLKVAFQNNGDISAKGWVDYVKLHARRLNKFDGKAMHYFDSKSVGDSIVTEFTIQSSSDEVVIWDVTNPFESEIIPVTRKGDKITFRKETDSLRTFIAFTNTNVSSPVILPDILPNQNLHASPPVDMVILTHPLLKKSAERLAEIHSRNSGLISLVVEPEQIYNEFSGGVPDIVAIRNFLRMKFLVQKGTPHPLRYLLLFGDGSFDNKTAPPGNTNYVPTYQTLNSDIVISSFTSDDFYGLLEDGEGEETGTEDIGIGRIPVSDTTAAGIVVSKIEGYLNPANQGNWKNVVCLSADDEDGNTHMYDAEGLADLIREADPWVNIEKIYFDAYNQVSSATGQFYPDVTQAINDRINSGILIFNYIGHGNETSLGHERVVTPESIEQWENISKLPLFITATCEFSRFDDISTNSVSGSIEGKNSSGERILLDSKGGAIALMSTTRLVYSAPNSTLNRNIIEVALDRDQDGNALRLGDIIRLAKNRTGNSTNKRNFLLLGDPAVRLSWPWHGRVVTDSINNRPAGQATDTLKALSMITVTGHIEDIKGIVKSDFKGVVVPLVFGQASEIKTLANDGGQNMYFSLQNRIIFSGKTSVEKGKFNFTFIVPRDIEYSYGKGKLSYYAYNDDLDLNGSFSEIMAGGFNDVNFTDKTGPEIAVYLNDTLFRNGGITDSDPKLLALIEDISGINTAGSGIGHDILCWLDNDRTNYFILNNYYENDFDKFNKGRLIYDLSGLSEGNHSLTLKVWDNFNNSSEKSVDFIVENDDIFILKNLLNYPNPFKNATNISLQHNRPDARLDITVTVFNMNGGVIRIINSSLPATGYQLAPIEWDGTISGGQKAGKGIYPFKVKITTDKGETSIISGRMIIY